MPIPFSPPSITQKEIDAVTAVLKSGWITTGPKTKEFESRLASYCGAESALCLSSATAGMELVLRLFDIGPGDEVITSPYTFAATANVILHTGATPVFADIQDGDFNLDPRKVEPLINTRTKAVIPVDFAGLPCDYQAFERLASEKQALFNPKKGSLQEKLGRILILSDAAHSFGSVYQGEKTGIHADFTVFSFHAVKNLTTAEGGAVLFNSAADLPAAELYKELRLLSLHGQSKDALAKFQAGNWFYTIENAGYKHNMTDIAAALGLAQLDRYESEILPARKKIFHQYWNCLKNLEQGMLPQEASEWGLTNYHLFPLRLKDPSRRNALISFLAKQEISANVHFIPVNAHPYYEKLGFKAQDTPRAYENFLREISLPIYPGLTEEQIDFVCEKITQFFKT